MCSLPVQPKRRWCVTHHMRTLLIVVNLLLFCATATSAQLTVRVEGVRSTKGKLLLSVYRSADGFPMDAAKAVTSQVVDAKTPATDVRFADLPAGTYAIALMHDENGNGKMDTNFMGIPKEGNAASNNAKGRMGPPKFADAKFQYSGQAQQIKLNINY